MTCRRRKNEKVVWFGSCGKDTKAERQIYNIVNDVTSVTGTITNQVFYFNFKAISATSIDFKDENDNVIDTVSVNAGSFNLKGILTAPLAKVELTRSDFDSDIPIILILEEYSNTIFYDENTLQKIESYSQMSNNDEKLKLIKELQQNNNYSKEQESVVDSLTQKLSVLKSELWYDFDYGLPLLEKTKSKLTLDSFILKVLNSHPDVVDVISFKSRVDNATQEYYCDIKVNSKYGIIEVKV